MHTRLNSLFLSLLKFQLAMPPCKMQFIKSRILNLSSVITLSCLISIATAIPLRAQECSCEQKFKFMKYELETNYAGYKDKVNPKTKAAYDKLTKETLAAAKLHPTGPYCLQALFKWKSFFKDSHVQLIIKDEHMDDSLVIEERIKNTEMLNISEKKLAELEHTTSYEEGIYYSPDSTYKIALVKNKTADRDFAGVIVDCKNKYWKPGMVKLELRKQNDSLYDAVMGMRNHSAQLRLFYFDGNSFDGGNWNKAGKKQKHQNVGDNFKYNDVYSSKLSDSTLYIQVGSFSMDNANAIDSLFKANAVNLRSMPNLILDLRRNGGGGDGAFEPILPYIYTNPVVGTGNDVYSTKDNIARFAKRLGESWVQHDDSVFYNAIIARMKKHPNSFVLHAGDDTLTMDSVLPYPRRIAVLMDKGCGSTTEEFLLVARQSKKVTLMGMNSYGVLDYSNWLVGDSPCPEIELHYSSTKSRRINKGQGIDNIGVKPTIRLTDEQEWIKEAEKYLLEKGKK